MNLTAEQIQDNWNELMEYINEDYISEPRKEKLLEFYSTIFRTFDVNACRA
jgi:hypothetical protein